jgi:hypothetical protein
LGSWKGVYFSEELNNSLKYGYKFKVLRGYIFEKENIFKDYVNSLYKIKESSNKGSALYIISKLLLNSLYGKFGMNPYVEKPKIIKESEYDNLNKNNINYDIINFNNGKLLVSFINQNSDRLNISIPISSAITAYSRIHMNNLIKELNDLGHTIYYTDTDSVFTDKPLPSHLISKELGKLKLENVFKKAVFLAPKVYGGITLDNKELIKIKGSKNVISYSELSKLLFKNNKIMLNQEKWYRNFEKGEICIKDEIYTLSITENKRQLIYKNNKFINTLPIKL